MALTSHLNNAASPIGQFIKQRFSQTNALTRDANRQLKNASTLRPVIQTGEQYPYAYLGTAIDYRIRYAFAITPYQQLVAWRGALKLMTKPWESDDDIPFDWESLPEGVSIPLSVGASGDPFAVAQGPYPLKLVQAFFDNLDTTLQALQPVGKLLEPVAEHMVDRYCMVLSFFEQVYRTNAYMQGSLIQPTVKQSVEELLAIPQNAWLDDMEAMFSLFYDRHQDLLSHPHVLNPAFAGSSDVGGADADFIVDGCLIDMKATISSQIRADFLYQLAGYLLLDYNDAYHITSVGIYMVRQGLLLKWDVSTFLQKLTGDDHVSLRALRQAFQTICQRNRE
ncbi:MAG: hypothetical protein WCD86_02470 [Ktedonobacteraceae bacterium]